MKIGLSSYSLYQAINSGEMTILDAIQWVADNGGDHIEIVPLGFSLDNNDELIEQIKEKAQSAGIELSHYLIGANFLTETKEAFDAEIERVKKQVDIANALGIKFMRHDVAWRAPGDTSIVQFEEDLPTIVDACQQIADYAAQYGITTSIENHGFHVQASDRVLRLLHEVNRSNFKTTVDIGNFLCADEDPVSAVKKNIGHASVLHFKDFYIRPSYQNPGEGFFQSIAGNYLRGAIVGQGDIDMSEIVRIVKASGFDGYVSIEFEGMEECKQASKIALNNVRRLLGEE